FDRDLLVRGRPGRAVVGRTYAQVEVQGVGKRLVRQQRYQRLAEEFLDVVTAAAWRLAAARVAGHGRRIQDRIRADRIVHRLLAEQGANRQLDRSGRQRPQ